MPLTKPEVNDQMQPATSQPPVELTNTAPVVEPPMHPAPPAAGAVATLQGGLPTTGDKFAAFDNKLGFGAFPRVKLDKDKFAVGEEGEIDDFLFKSFGAASRYAYKNEAKEVFFSQDGITATDGRTVESIIADWNAEGSPLVSRSEYVDVFGKILSGQFEGTYVVLSVPPVSVSRLAGLRAILQQTEGKDLNDVTLKIEKGAKIKTKKGDTFYPWKFTVAKE